LVLIFINMIDFDTSGPVHDAIYYDRPIVALESTIISHGMPYPKNIETAMEVENEVLKNGATPATIAIINGRIKVGLTLQELEILGKKEQPVMKVSRRDLPYVLMKRLHGATTVAATMIIAKMAGIRIFATGGIGGVHRGAATSFDISADLQELANTQVAVVCAGVKSILDIGATLEYLETFGVPVVGYKTDEFPAFFSSKSGYNVDFNLNSSEEIAEFIVKKWEFPLKGGVLITNPIPEAYDMDAEKIEYIIAQALKDAEKSGIKGKEITPFLLSKVNELSKGESLTSNIALIKNNAALAAQIACYF
jgi:pseudouridylate synthase